MMPDIDPSRLAKLCEMMASPHDGEALTAARKANELIRGAGLTWTDIVMGSNNERPSQGGRSREHYETDPDVLWEKFEASHPGQAAWILRHSDSFDFARSLRDSVLKWGRLTPKQAAAVERGIARERAWA